MATRGIKMALWGVLMANRGVQMITQDQIGFKYAVLPETLAEGSMIICTIPDEVLKLSEGCGASRKHFGNIRGQEEVKHLLHMYRICCP